MSLRRASQLTNVDLNKEQLEDGPPRHRRHKESPKMAETWGEIWSKWPMTTFCIVVNEFCERFSFYGMKTVLQIYLLNVLKFTDKTSAVFFNSFTALCYLTPLFGSYIADGYIGKFKTIFIVSIVYAIGQIVLALASIQDSGSSLHPWIDFLGLFIIAVGTGGIKPCVSPFGGDQFEPHESKMISLFFSVFYFSINAGSLISTFASPIMRSMPCLGKDSCYPLAFGLPAVLMIIATIAFILGSFWYKKPIPKSNVYNDIGSMFKRAFKHRSGKKAHWLDHALNRHDCYSNPKCMRLKRKRHDLNACADANFIDDIKSMLKLFIMFIPMTVFWSLYDQQGSFWTTQAIQMDCRLWGNTLLLPDQMQVVNPIFIMVLIFVFESAVYPIVGKFFAITSLRKMCAGGLFASLAFLISAFVQLKVNTTLPILPSNGNAYVSLMNTLGDCDITAFAVGYKPDAGILVPSNTSLQNSHNDIQLFEVKRDEHVQFTFNYSKSCPPILPQQASFNVTGSQYFYIHASERGMFVSGAETKKPTAANGEFSMGITVSLTDQQFSKNIALCRVDGKKTSQEYPCDPSQKLDFYFYDNPEPKTYWTSTGEDTKNPAVVFEFNDVRPGRWRLYYVEGEAKGRTDTAVNDSGIQIDRVAQGGVYAMSLTGKSSETPKRLDFRVVADNGLSILWQLPQIFVITLAEILFSLTGNEFSYTQAAPSMKSLAGAVWLWTTFVGDSLIVVLTLISFTDNVAIMFMFYAGLMAVVVLVIILMSVYYFEYSNYTGENARGDDSDSEDEYDEDSLDNHSSTNVKAILNGDTNNNKEKWDAAWDNTRF